MYICHAASTPPVRGLCWILARGLRYNIRMSHLSASASASSVDASGRCSLDFLLEEVRSWEVCPHVRHCIILLLLNHTDYLVRYSAVLLVYLLVYRCIDRLQNIRCHARTTYQVPGSNLPTGLLFIVRRRVVRYIRGVVPGPWFMLQQCWCGTYETKYQRENVTVLLKHCVYL